MWSLIFAAILSVPVWSAPRDFTLKVQANNTAPRQLKISATTDLPDGAIVTLSVSRDYDETITDKHLPKKAQTASGEIYTKDHVVAKGRVEATVNVDDSVWVQKRDALAKRMSAAEVIFSPVRNVRPSVEVRALYTPLNNAQPKHVIAATGQRGELIRNVKGDYGLKVLGDTKLVPVPFKPK